MAKTTNKPRPDWTKTGTVEGYANYVRKQSGAFVVLVIRRDDAVLSVDEHVRLKDAEDLVLAHWRELAERIEALRKEENKAVARLNWGDLRE